MRFDLIRQGKKCKIGKSGLLKLERKEERGGKSMAQDLKNRIKEQILDSCFGEDWGENIQFHDAYEMAKVIYTYLFYDKKVSIDKLEETEVEQMLKLQIPMSQMYSQGIYFLRGWKCLVRQIGNLQKETANPVAKPELFLECLQNVLTINIYEKNTEHPEAEWIFEQKDVLKKMAGFVWFWESVNYVRQEELTYSIQDGLTFLFENQNDKSLIAQTIIQIQDKCKDIPVEERFVCMFGTLYIEFADTFKKVCAFTEQGVDETRLGRFMLEQFFEQELWQTDERK